MGSQTVLGIVGSPNPKGRTNELVSAALDGAAKAGAQTELLQLSDHVVEACKDCLPWVCLTNLKCTYDDPAFEYVSEKLKNCGALVLGTPVYWADTSGLIRYLILKMFRVYARSGPLKDVPALGIAIAGGTGNGLVSGLRPLYQFFQMMAMRPLEPLPSTRFNFAATLQRAGELGEQIAGMAQERQPMGSYEERIMAFDSLPYLGLNRAGERRLLADLTTAALPEDADPGIALELIKSDTLAAAGKHVEALTGISRVYSAGAKAFEKKPAS